MEGNTNTFMGVAKSGIASARLKQSTTRHPSTIVALVRKHAPGSCGHSPLLLGHVLGLDRPGSDHSNLNPLRVHADYPVHAARFW